MKRSLQEVESIRERLAETPPVDPSEHRLGTRAAVLMLSAEIKGLRERGYTWLQIADLLSREGLAIRASTLRVYLRKSNPRGSSRKVGHGRDTRRHGHHHTRREAGESVRNTGRHGSSTPCKTATRRQEREDENIVSTSVITIVNDLPTRSGDMDGELLDPTKASFVPREDSKDL